MDFTSVLRIEKIQTYSELYAKSKHCYSMIDIEEQLFKKEKEALYNKPIYTLFGSKNNIYKDIKEIKLKYNVEERKNSCKAIEGILSLSPEFFKLNNKEKIKDFTNRSMSFLNTEFKNQLAHAVLHLHEDTPHIHFFLVPWEILNKRGKVSVPNYNGIRTKGWNRSYLSSLQERFNSTFLDLGIKSINQKSTSGIDRTTLKEHYVKVSEIKNKEIEMNKKEVEKLKCRLIAVESNNLKKSKIIKTLKQDLKAKTEINSSIRKEKINLKKDNFQLKKEVETFIKAFGILKRLLKINTLEDLVHYITDRFSKEQSKIEALNYKCSNSVNDIKIDAPEHFELPKYLKKNTEAKNMDEDIPKVKLKPKK